MMFSGPRRPGLFKWHPFPALLLIVHCLDLFEVLDGEGLWDLERDQYVSNPGEQTFQQSGTRLHKAAHLPPQGHLHTCMRPPS